MILYFKRVFKPRKNKNDLDDKPDNGAVTKTCLEIIYLDNIKSNKKVYFYFNLFSNGSTTKKSSAIWN